MKENEKKMELLENAPVPRALLALGLPTMVGMMINALYNLVDACLLYTSEPRRCGHLRRRLPAPTTPS